MNISEYKKLYGYDCQVPLISVLVTNYNYGSYVGRCIRSLLDQSLDEDIYEIIVVDDGSTDSSKEVISIFKDEIRIIEMTKNEGLSVAANLGLKAARGRYVVRVDSDDYVHPDFLKVLTVAFELLGDQTDAISCDYFKVSELGEILSRGDQKIEPIACGVAFKAEVFERLGYYNEGIQIYEEVDFMKKFNASGLRKIEVNLPLYRYVQHEKSLTRRIPK